ncbi:MAG TPA: hypothetical protein VMF12_03150, partial [Xanthobacteraceae bacterium]|nr:hypothetical protein [Xanthobacteraceae bacterium]
DGRTTADGRSESGTGAKAEAEETQAEGRPGAANRNQRRPVQTESPAAGGATGADRVAGAAVDRCRTTISISLAGAAHNGCGTTLAIGVAGTAVNGCGAALAVGLA